MRLENMSVNEFVALVQTRQEILMELKINKNNNERIEMLKKLVEIQNVFLNPTERTLKFKEREYIVDFQIKRRLQLEYYDFNKFIKDNFGKEVYISKMSTFFRFYDIYIMQDKKGKKYKLFDSYDGYVNLNMLYSAKYYKDWNKLFAQDPNLKERIWTWVKENVIKRDKKQTITLIQKMIEEKHKEMTNLRNPKYIEKRIKELEKEIAEKNEELKSNYDKLDLI